jgi:phosphatidylserine decarboxylase
MCVIRKLRGAVPTTAAENKRIDNPLPLAREGFPFIASGMVLTCLFFGLHLPLLGALFCLLTLFTVYFFRDPARSPRIEEKGVFAPADGKIVQVTLLQNPVEGTEEKVLKVSVFMSLFDVHVDRIPVAGKISTVNYHPGRFLAANMDKASEQNERNTVTLETGDGRKVVFVQVAGLIARRIACWVKQGDEVRTGQRFGLIRFGSRLDIYLPGASRVTAVPGQKVRAGETVIGYLP